MVQRRRTQPHRITVCAAFAVLVVVSMSCIIYKWSVLIQESQTAGSRVDFQTYLDSLRFVTGSARHGGHHGLQPWERDTSLEYELTLSSDTSRSAPPTVRHYDFEISSVASRMDGVQRPIIAINGKYPGPLVEGVEGDTIIIHVMNRLDEMTTLHFHGLAQNGSNYMDGPLGITQCGISPGQRFTYKFIAEPSGTHWYHAHTGLQVAKGLVGPAVIHSRRSANSELGQQSTEKADEKDFVVLLSDLYDDDADELMLDYREPWFGGTEPAPGLALINGRQRPILTFPRNKTARMRIINAASFTVFRVGLDWHHLAVEEVDGGLVWPVNRQTIDIFPGQRYTASVEPKNQSTRGRNFWFRATAQHQIWDLPNPKFRPDVRAIFHYQDEVGEQIKLGDLEDDSDMEVHADLKEPYFIPAFGLPPVPSQGQVHNIDVWMQRDAEGSIQARMNTTSMPEERRYNSLARILRNVPDPGRSMLLIDELVTVDLVVRNYDDGPHPFHLHGYKFWIIERGNIDHDNPAKWLPVTPMSRDTAWLPEGQYVRLRFIADNPGVWLFHCHIPWHAMTGMQANIVTLPSQLRQQKPGPEWYHLCHG